ncbi:MAG TPA: GDSL-type esterase/lipase family protein [Spirochaetota bacterium]|nr:GDSL-type esterase/lipase family protein [Spirochaetota bacterium]HRZ25686.1 GDSL-type esterase/lipase family protein [Spirochaetota bacterium]HSA13313.1 GDSL-type esterase/lipase family protein [Spirochaetota bacterium]
MKPSGILQKIQSKEKITIVGLGDSLTQGWMARKGYLDFLKELLHGKYPAKRFTVINSGIPGDTAEGGLHRLSRDALDYNPDVILVQFALNDAFIGVPVDIFRNQIAGIVATIKNDSDAEAALLTSVYIREPAEYRMAKVFYDALEKVSAKENIPFARVHEYWEKAVGAGADHGRMVQYDGVHPTVDGYRLMAEAVFGLFGD